MPELAFSACSGSPFMQQKHLQPALCSMQYEERQPWSSTCTQQDEGYWMLFAKCMWFSDSTLSAPLLVHSCGRSELQQAAGNSSGSKTAECHMPWDLREDCTGSLIRPSVQGSDRLTKCFVHFRTASRGAQDGLPDSAVDAEELPDCCSWFHFFVLGTTYQQGAQQKSDTMTDEHKLPPAMRFEADMHVNKDGSSYVPQECAEEREAAEQQ